MTLLNEMDRFHLVGGTIDRMPPLGSRAAYVKQAIRDKLIAPRQYINRHGEDMPESRHWQ
jgi:xylulose-5-phosphate/fructose-6-phosphate phosphoketolase